MLSSFHRQKKKNNNKCFFELVCYAMYLYNLLLNHRIIYYLIIVYNLFINSEFSSLFSIFDIISL